MLQLKSFTVEFVLQNVTSGSWADNQIACEANAALLRQMNDQTFGPISQVRGHIE